MIAIGTGLTIGWLLLAGLSGSPVALILAAILSVLVIDTRRRDNETGRVREPELQAQGEIWSTILLIGTAVIILTILLGYGH